MKIFTKRKGQEQSTDSQNNGGGCSVDQSPDTSCESADDQNKDTPVIKRMKFILKPSKEGVKVLHQMHKEENTSSGSTYDTYSGYTSSTICYYGLPDHRKGNGI